MSPNATLEPIKVPKERGVSIRCAEQFRDEMLVRGWNGSKPRIGLDVDDTIAATKIAAIAEIKRRGGQIEMEQLTTPFLEDHVTGIKLTLADVKAIFTEIWTERPHEIALVDPRIPFILRRFRGDIDISITTATDADDSSLIKWLSSKGIPFDEIVHVTSTSKKLGESPHVDLYLDDFEKVVHDAAQEGRGGILLKRPWNATYRHSNSSRRNPRVIHGSDWGHIEELLEVMRKVA